MENKLLEELKNAGFPFKKYECVHCGSEWNSETPHPTLEQIIDACVPEKADDFGLSLENDRWHAWYFYVGYFEHNKRFQEADGSYLVDLNVYGETQVEAFTSLWLALNSK